MQIVQSVPRTIMAWRSELSEASYSLMCKFSHLLHTLMAHHLGFPDLYEPVLNAIKVCLKEFVFQLKTLGRF